MELICKCMHWKRLGQVGHLQHQPMLVAINRLNNSQSVQVSRCGGSLSSKEVSARSGKLGLAERAAHEGVRVHGVSRAAHTKEHACTVQIQPCPIKSTHPWERCCYAHPHENARRRDPRQYKYIAEPCPDYKRGICLLVSPATPLTATCATLCTTVRHLPC